MSSNELEEEIVFNVCRTVSFYEVATLDGKIVGGVFAIPFIVDNSSSSFPGETFLEICTLNINKGFRRRGCGRRLMNSILADFGDEYLCLMVEKNPVAMSREDLIAWYMRLGFTLGSPFHEGEGWMSRSPTPKEAKI